MNIKKTGVEKLDAEAASKNLYGITVPIITAETTEEEGRNNPRAPFYAVYKFILDDLASAEELLSDYQRPTKNLPCTPVVHGLMARMWLEMGSRFELYPEDLNTLNNNTDLNIASKETCFTKAAEYARKVINESGAMPLTEKEWFDGRRGSGPRGGRRRIRGAETAEPGAFVWGCQAGAGGEPPHHGFAAAEQHPAAKDRRHSSGGPGEMRADPVPSADGAGGAQIH